MIFSCSSKKDILYLQNSNDKPTFNSGYSDYKIQIDDILKITVFAENLETVEIFNIVPTINSGNLTKDAYLLNGYQVNTKGYISFKGIGDLYVLNRTIEEIKIDLKNIYIDKKLLTNPLIDIKVINSSFTILGEVFRPGRYDFMSNNLNILEAIGLAGDLTIKGERSNIKLIREDNNGQKIIHSLDLTNSDILNDDYFQIISGDIIIVNPNKNRIKNAGIIENAGTLLSLLSFILSSIILTTSN